MDTHFERLLNDADILKASLTKLNEELRNQTTKYELETNVKEIKDQHIKRLKTYNELRDIGLRLVQIIADEKKCPLKEVFEEMGHSMADD